MAKMELLGMLLLGFCTVSAEAAPATSIVDGSKVYVVKQVPASGLGTSLFPDALQQNANTANEISMQVEFQTTAANDLVCTTNCFVQLYISGGYYNAATSEKTAGWLFTNTSTANGTAVDTGKSNLTIAAAAGSTLGVGTTTFSITNATAFAGTNAEITGAGTALAVKSYLFVRSDVEANASPVIPQCGMSVKIDAASAANATSLSAKDATTGAATMLSCTCQANASATKTAGVTTFPVNLQSSATIGSVAIQFYKRKANNATAAASVAMADLMVPTISPTQATDKKITYQWDGQTAVAGDSFNGGSGLFVFQSPTGTGSTPTATAKVADLKVTSPSGDNAWKDIETACDSYELWVAAYCHRLPPTNGISPSNPAMGPSIGQKATTVTVKQVTGCGSGSGAAAGAQIWMPALIALNAVMMSVIA